MIDVENEIFNIVSVRAREKYPKIFMTGELVRSPPSFPCVSLIETDNQAYRSTMTTEEIENHVQVIYEVNVYSNKTKGKKSECKEIISLIDEQLTQLGFVRTMLSQIPNDYDATIYRMVGRYKAVISRENIIYRR